MTDNPELVDNVRRLRLELKMLLTKREVSFEDAMVLSDAVKTLGDVLDIVCLGSR